MTGIMRLPAEKEVGFAAGVRQGDSSRIMTL